MIEDFNDRLIEIDVDYCKDCKGQEFTATVDDVVYGKMVVTGKSVPDCLRGIARSMDVSAKYFSEKNKK